MTTPASRLLFALFLCAALRCSSRLSAQISELPPASVPVEEWLRGPDRQDFPWKVRVARQSLTFQQRHLTQILVTIRARDLLKGVSTRDLHFVTKIADSDGNWLPGQSYSHFVPPKDFSGKDLLQPITNFYLQPGNYTVAVLAYDSLSNRGNCWRSKILVPRLSAPLAELDQNFPVVEFLPAFEVSPELKASGDWALNTPASLGPSLLDPMALGHGTAHLPIANKQPVRIDLVVNLSRGPDRAPAYKYSEGLVLQVGNLLSQLAPQKGCVRFSALDALRQDLIVDRVESHKLEWDVISKKVAAVELNVIDVKALKEREAALWFQRAVERINDDPSACAPQAGTLKHVLVVVSMPFTFPGHALLRPAKPKSPQPRCYYFKILFKDNNWDEIENVLKPMQPTRLTFSDSRELRRKLDFIIADLSNLPE